MDHKASCGVTSRGLIVAIPSQAHKSSCAITGEGGFFASGHRGLPSTIIVTGQALGLDDTKPFQNGIAYADDPVGAFSVTFSHLPDPFTDALTTTLEFDRGTGSGGGGTGDGNVNFKGDWNSSASYSEDDIVIDDGASFIATSVNNNKKPAENPSYWTPLGSGASDATAVIYTNTTYTTVQAALDALLYVPPKINSFSNNIGTVEKGSSVSTTTLTWAFNKTMATASLDQGIGSVPPGSSSIDVSEVFTTDTSWTLTVSDGTNSASANTSITFQQKRYWGATAFTELTDTDILGLGGSEFAASFKKAVSYDCSGGKYPYLVYPASLGPLSEVTVGGLAFSDFNIVTQDFTNASGLTESYHVVRFNGLQTGSPIRVIWG